MANCQIQWIDAPSLRHFDSPTPEAVAYVRCVFIKLEQATGKPHEPSEIYPCCQAHLDYMNQKLVPDWEVVKFRFDVQGASELDITWTSNLMEYDTPELAETAAKDLFSRWMGMKDWRVVPAYTPRNQLIADHPKTK